MKVLWLCNYNEIVDDGNVYRAGWIAPLLDLLSKRCEVLISIAAPSLLKRKKYIKDGICFYPLYCSNRKLQSLFNSKKHDTIIIEQLLESVHDFQPDLIHIWGSESELGLISCYTDVPSILHIQGVINPYLDAYFPPNYSMHKIWIKNGFNIFNSYRYYYRWYKKLKRNALREKRILSSVDCIMGRTEWDKNLSSFLSPQASYRYCSEILRKEFYDSPKWIYHKRESKLIVVSVISNPLCKGQDAILKTALHIKEKYGEDFEWKIFGIGDNDIVIHEKMTEIKAHRVNVVCMGKTDAQNICSALLSADVFCHLSYIENSPNCVCEAQILGVPVVATDVGGTRDLIKEDGGILIPSNDAYSAAVSIIRIKNDKTLSEKLSKSSIQIATKRHSVDSIVKSVLSVYDEYRVIST